jgi:predicted regulator of Ras-like GTPase activity (Roadblock/LC7/MglB family)
MPETPFTPILRRMLDALPDALGAVFADGEGEAVDQLPDPREDPEAAAVVDLRLFGAHWGVILNHVNAALRLFHYGGPIEMILHHDRLDILIHAVGDGYYVLLALRADGHLARALDELRRGAVALQAEM